jgi:hypothetical protein
VLPSCCRTDLALISCAIFFCVNIEIARFNVAQHCLVFIVQKRKLHDGALHGFSVPNKADKP